MRSSVRIKQPTGKTAARAVDQLVLATVNAPYKRTIGAATLAGCLGKADSGNWSVHIATFFTDVSPKLILAFAAAHGLSKSQLARAYAATKRMTGEQNPDLEAALGSLAVAAS
jgi:hypothetical protein